MPFREVFQFYDSPIKSMRKRIFTKENTKFQFYDSPIKSYPFASDNPSLCVGFNSMIVRLKEFTLG